VKTLFIYLVIVDGHDGPVGAYQGTHPATHTGMSHLCTLPYPMVDTKNVRGFLLQSYFYGKNPLPVYAQFNGLYRTYSGTMTAEATFFLIPKDNPGKVLGT